MDGALALAACQMRILKNGIGKLRAEPKLKTIFISVAIIAFWLASLALFHRGLSFFNQFPIVGPALVDETIFIFFAVLFIMLTLSGIVVCYTTFYNSSEVDFLFSKPIDHRAIFFYRLIQAVLFSSWAFLFLGVPFFIAYAGIKGAPVWFYFTLPFYFIAFILFPTALASLLILTAVRYIRYGKIKHVLLSAALIASLAAYWYYKTHLSATVLPRVDIAYFLDTFLSHLRLLKHPLFPGYWMAKSVIGAGAGDPSQAFFYYGSFFATTLVALQINWFMAENVYYQGWLSSKSGTGTHNYPPDRGVLNRLLRVFAILPRPTAALVIKDIKIFIRDFAQWSQFMIYIAILGIYIFNLRSIPMSRGNPYWTLIVTFLNLSATALVLAGFTVRFLYPLISLEGTKIWILGLAPITFRGLIFQKFIINLAVVLCVSEFLMISTNVMLDTSPMLFYTSCVLTGLVSIGLVGLSIGLGSIYPNFREDNPSRIVSGFGGTLNFVVALVYIFIIIIIFAAPTFSYEIRHSISAHTFHILIALSWITTTAATGAVGILPLILGYRTLKHREF